jgi:hypothetical protein
VTPTASNGTANHSTDLMLRLSSAHMELIQQTTVITKEKQQSHKWTATTRNTTIAASGTSIQAATLFQSGAAPHSTFKRHLKGTQQDKQHETSTNQDCNHVSAC